MKIIDEIYVHSPLSMSGYLQLNNIKNPNNAVYEINAHTTDKQTFGSTDFKNFSAGTLSKILMKTSITKSE